MRPVTRADAKPEADRNAGAAPPHRSPYAPRRGAKVVNFRLRVAPSRPSRLRVNPFSARSNGAARVRSTRSGVNFVNFRAGRAGGEWHVSTCQLHQLPATNFPGGKLF